MSQILFALLAAVFWGSAPVFEKIGLKNLSPFVAVFVRSLAVLIISGIAITLSSHGWNWIYAEGAGKGIVMLAIGGILSAFIGQFFYFTALKSGSASIVVPLASTYPLVAVLLALLFLKEGLSLHKFAGIILVISGIILLSR